MNLYRRSAFWASAAVSLAVLALMVGARAAQHRGAHKLRATALIERTVEPGGAITTQVFPITIFAEGNFHDASTYESKPTPMALQNGVAYEAEKNGIPVGYVTITSGSHTPVGWIALGKWQAASQIQAAKSRPATPATVTPPADDRPILHREGESVPAPSPSPSPTPAPTSAPPSDDRPVLHRGGSGSEPSPTPVPAPTQSGSDDDRPVLHRHDSGQDTSATPSAAPTPSSAPEPSQPEAGPVEDPDRPMLKHRVPSTTGQTQSATPVLSNTQGAAQGQSAPKQIALNNSPGTQMLLGISDAQSYDTRSYDYHWEPSDQQQIEIKMRKLALAQLPGQSAQSPESLANVVVRSFDLDLSNDAVVVITAEDPPASPAPSGKVTRAGPAAKKAAPVSTPGKPVSRFVTVIARVDIDGNPQKVAASVTDSSRLDVAPRLELIDAVDVDGDGIAELVFREYDFDQKTFIIYSVGHGTVTKLFEGASEPLKPEPLKP